MTTVDARSRWQRSPPSEEAAPPAPPAGSRGTAATACCASRCRSSCWRSGLPYGSWSCASKISRPTSCRRPVSMLQTLGADWALLSASLLVTLDHHVRRLPARGGRRGRARGPVHPVAAGRIFALSLRRHPAGDADRRHGAAVLDLPAAAGGGARLRLDRGLLSRPGQHHARPELGRPQSRRPVRALRRLARAGAVAPQAAVGAALISSAACASPAGCR